MSHSRRASSARPSGTTRRRILPRLIDARVQLRGNVGTLFGRSEQLRGVSLFVGRTSDVVVLESPPDPFSLPTRSVRSIYNYSPAGEVNRRIRVHGVVTCYIPGHPVELSDFTSTARFRFVRHVLYVDDGTGSRPCGNRTAAAPPPRHRRRRSRGFPRCTPGKPILTNAVFKVAGEAPQPTAIARRRRDGPDTGERRRAGAHGRTSAEHAHEPDAADPGPQGRRDRHRRRPREHADAPADALERIRPGSVVAVTGVYSYQWGPPPSFRLFLRSARRRVARIRRRHGGRCSTRP